MIDNYAKRLWPFVVVITIMGLFSYLRWFRKPDSIPYQPGEQGEQESLESWRKDFSESDLDLLARVVRAEAQGEPYDGQVAVAAVILNRVKHPEFPNTIPGVVYEPLAFSVVANGQVNKPADESAIQAAHCALNGLDPSGGALYFYNPSKTKSVWIRSREVIKTIGDHIFAS
jgi:spore germination cell wall hydrolase CwlJ-like protein